MSAVPKVERRFGQFLMREIALQASRMETPQDRERRDQLWLRERAGLLWPLIVAKNGAKSAWQQLQQVNWRLVLHLLTLATIVVVILSVCRPSDPYLRFEAKREEARKKFDESWEKHWRQIEAITVSEQQVAASGAAKLSSDCLPQHLDFSSVAIGPRDVGDGSAVAIGPGAVSSATGAIAIGSNAVATGTSAIAIGIGATVSE